ncbi:aldolase [Priestia sp. SB1]|uniref:aldolase n=1 Tax=Priestia sp. SB1 TaxID=3132359 RepID=UPI0031724C81
MINTFKKNVYKAFGLTILSEIPLLELIQTNVVSDEIDIVIERADLSRLWLQHASSDEDFVIKKDWVMFRMPETAIFLVQNGRRILVSPMNVAHENEIRLYILGTCMGAILLQRKILPLHGSAIAINGKAYAIVGDSGAGKSTLASAFLTRGFQLLSDDVIPVTLDNENIPIIKPSYPQQKLWLESLNHFGMESNKYQPLFVRETKYAVPVHSQFATEALPLAGIFELVKGDKEEIELQPIQNLKRFYKLYYHTYRNFFIEGSGLMEWHFNTCSKIINKIDFYQLRRPTTRFTAHDLTELILNTIKVEGKV